MVCPLLFDFYLHILFDSLFDFGYKVNGEENKLFLQTYLALLT